MILLLRSENWIVPPTSSDSCRPASERLIGHLWTFQTNRGSISYHIFDVPSTMIDISLHSCSLPRLCVSISPAWTSVKVVCSGPTLLHQPPLLMLVPESNPAISFFSRLLPARSKTHLTGFNSFLRPLGSP